MNGPARWYLLTCDPFALTPATRPAKIAPSSVSPIKAQVESIATTCLSREQGEKLLTRYGHSSPDDSRFCRGITSFEKSDLKKTFIPAKVEREESRLVAKD